MEFLETIKKLYNVKQLKGYTNQDIEKLKSIFGKIPPILEEYYCIAGRTEKFHNVQDKWILPEYFEKYNSLINDDYIILINENQGVCQACINKKDLSMQNPPVYVYYDCECREIYTNTTYEFIMSTLLYQSIFTMDYTSEEFLCINEEEFKFIKSNFNKYPYEIQNWMFASIAFYYNSDDNLIVIFNCDNEDLQMLYGATNEIAYNKLLDIIGNIGESL